jgi:hypothetical protein
MRTTLTIEDYIMRELKEEAYRTGQPLKKVVNDALQAGLVQMKRPGSKKPYRCKTYSMGTPRDVNLDKALQIAEKIEDEEITRKLLLRK